MLAEFFLTPDAFCRNNDDLNGLRACLFPFGNTPVALISHLGGCQWKNAISSRIARIQNQNHRHRAMELFNKICEEISVIRPSHDCVPSSESEWVRNAIRSNGDLELDGIVASPDIENLSANGTNLPGFVLPEFWNNYCNPRLVDRERNAQKKVLRAFCAFSDWIIIRFPQIRGGSDDEIVTVKQVIQSATTLPNGYKKSDVEIQFPLDERASDNPDRVFRSVSAELRELANSTSKLTLTMLPVNSFINREILGGEYTSVSSGETRQRSRWLITMNHVAVGGQRESGRDDANSWNLYSRREANKRLQILAGNEPLRSERLQDQ